MNLKRLTKSKQKYSCELDQGRQKVENVVSGSVAWNWEKCYTPNLHDSYKSRCKWRGVVLCAHLKRVKELSIACSTYVAALFWNYLLIRKVTLYAVRLFKCRVSHSTTTAPPADYPQAIPKNFIISIKISSLPWGLQ